MNVRFEPPLPAAEQHPVYTVYDRQGGYAGRFKYADGTLFLGYVFYPEIDMNPYTPETLSQILAALDQLNGGKR